MKPQFICFLVKDNCEDQWTRKGKCTTKRIIINQGNEYGAISTLYRCHLFWYQLFKTYVYSERQKVTVMIINKEKKHLLCVEDPSL